MLISLIPQPKRLENRDDYKDRFYHAVCEADRIVGFTPGQMLTVGPDSYEIPFIAQSDGRVAKMKVCGRSLRGASRDKLAFERYVDERFQVIQVAINFLG